jgi:hypothetical protein
MSEYKPSFVYSSRKRSAVRRITPAGWLTLAVVAAVVLLGSALAVNAVKGSLERNTWGGAPQPESVAAVAPAKAGARATATPHVVEMTETPTPEGWVWWSEHMIEGENGLVPHQGVQQEIKLQWQIYWSHMSLPLSEIATFAAEEYAERYAMTYEFAERFLANAVPDKRMATGKMVVVQSETVNLRDGPGTTHETIGQVNAGTRFLLLDEESTAGQTWYLAWDMSEDREVWVASWLVETRDNAWPYPEYEEHDIVVHDCTDDGLTCFITDTMSEGGTGYYNLVTGEQGLYTSDNAPYPPTGIRVQGRMVYDSERMVWLCDGIDWEVLPEDE